jgi:hypothetical protein
MITQLKAEKERIENGCGKANVNGMNWICGSYNLIPSAKPTKSDKKDYCKSCQQQLSDLKKYSIMWADGFKEIIDKFRYMVAEDGLRRLQGEKPKLAWSDLFDYFHNELKLKEIKSLMEKQ